jgi:uncharacterized protein involved in exopolysaccharide biosynthesis
MDLMRSLQLHRRLALSIAAVGFVLGLIFYFTKAPVYTAQAIVYVQPAPPSVIQQGFSSRWPYDASTYDSYIQQQIGNAMREDVLTSAMKKLGEAARKPNQSDEDALNNLRNHLAVARVGQTYQFSIEARASKPELAAETANAVATSYIESTAHDQRASDQQRLTMLREERDRVQSALDADRAEQQELNKQLGVASVAGAPDHFDQDITELHTELVKARTEHDSAEARFAAMGANHGESATAIDAAADESANTDAGLVSMKTALNARKAVLISKMANLTPGNPEYKQDAAELTQINGNLDQMIKGLHTQAASRIQLQLRSELERTAGVEAQLNGQLRNLVSNATNATSKLQRSSDLAADITRLQVRYSSVDEQLHNLLLEDAAPSGAYVSTPADVPNHRSKSGRTRNTALIVMAGILLGMLAAVVRHKMDRHVYVASDLEGILGFGPMAMLPDFAEVSEGAAEEHLLRLAAAIEHAHRQSHLRSWVFTGTGSGTGVTTIVTRVRALLAAMGSPTVSVDASGTSEDEEPAVALARGTEGSSALVTADGRSRQQALSYRMVSEGENQPLVLTDAAPIAVSAETEYLARFADCAIVVVQSGLTTRAEIREAATTLQRLNVGAVGFVLNRIGKAKADPAFLASLDAVEKHLQSQMGIVARRKRRTDAAVAATTAEPIVKPAEVPASVPVLRSQATAKSTQPSSSQAASPASSRPHAPTPEATRQQAESRSPEPVPESIPEPVSRFISEDLSFSELIASKKWTQEEWAAPASHVAQAASAEVEPIEHGFQTSAVAKRVDNAVPASPEVKPVKQPAVASFAARAVEDPFLAQFFTDPPAASFEAFYKPETVSMSQPKPAPHDTFSAPVVLPPAPQPPHVGDPQWNYETLARPNQHTADPALEERGTEPAQTDFQLTENPALAAPAVHQSTWAQREHLPVPAQPDVPRQSEAPADSVAARPSEKPVPERDPDIPWWLSDAPGQRAVQPASFLWQGDLAIKSSKGAADLPPDPFEFPLHADPSRNKRAELPLREPFTDPNRSVPLQSRPATQPVLAPAFVAVQEDAPERLTSRLSGLRSLLTGLGLKEAHSPVATTEVVDPHLAPLARGSAAAPLSTRGSEGKSQSSSSLGQAAPSASRETLAQPEFLKPSAPDQEDQPGDSKLAGKSLVRIYKPDTEFEMPTLPSKRGQYRNV